MGEIRLSRLLLLLRQARGLKQGELARRAKICQSAICKYETSDVEPSPQLLRRIAKGLELDVSAIVGVMEIETENAQALRIRQAMLSILDQEAALRSAIE